jgi:diguanylate cyclase (GGDEF)-like protein
MNRLSDLDAIVARLQENEAIAERFYAVEAQILTIYNFQDLFEVLLSEIRQRFAVPYVWLSLVKDSEVQGMIQSLGKSNNLGHDLNIIGRKRFQELVGTDTRPVLANTDLIRYADLFPANSVYLAQSLAVAPITLDGDIIGSLNQADPSSQRFQPGIDTSLLQRLAVKVSLCLSNVTAHEKLRMLAYHDPLTGLLNRRVMETVLDREAYRAQRYEIPLSVVFLDLDRFKAINDGYGHDCGDAALKYLAESLLGITRQSDIVARFAGDEFVAILPQTKATQAMDLMGRLQSHLISHPLVYQGGKIPLAVSFGIVSTEEGFPPVSMDLLRAADARLYRAKAKKRAQRSG